MNYWKENTTLELMVRGDIDLSLISRMDFVKHHKKQCCIDWSTCPYLDVDWNEAGVEMCAALLSRTHALDFPKDDLGLIGGALSSLRVSLVVMADKCSFGGPVAPETQASEALMQTLMASIPRAARPKAAQGMLDSARDMELANLFSDRIAMLDVFSARVRTQMGLKLDSSGSMWIAETAP